MLEQRRPRAIKVGERLYIAWENQSPPGYAYDREAFVQQLEVMEPDDGRLDVLGEWRLPLEGPATGDQEMPALASSPLFPDGALVAVWESTGDVMIGVRPSPIVELLQVTPGS